MSVTKLSALSAPPPATFKRLLKMPLLLTTPGSHTEHGVWINTRQVYEGGCVSLRAMIPNDLWAGLLPSQGPSHTLTSKKHGCSDARFKTSR